MAQHIVFDPETGVAYLESRSREPLPLSLKNLIQQEAAKQDVQLSAPLFNIPYGTVHALIVPGQMVCTYLVDIHAINFRCPWNIQEDEVGKRFMAPNLQPNGDGNSASNIDPETVGLTWKPEMAGIKYWLQLSSDGTPAYGFFILNVNGKSEMRLLPLPNQWGDSGKFCWKYTRQGEQTLQEWVEGAVWSWEHTPWNFDLCPSDFHTTFRWDIDKNQWLWLPETSRHVDCSPEQEIVMKGIERWLTK